MKNDVTCFYLLRWKDIHTILLKEKKKVLLKKREKKVKKTNQKEISNMCATCVQHVCNMCTCVQHVCVQKNIWKDITEVLALLPVGCGYEHSILLFVIFLNLSVLQSSCIMLTSV